MHQGSDGDCDERLGIHFELDAVEDRRRLCKLALDERLGEQSLLWLVVARQSWPQYFTGSLSTIAKALEIHVAGRRPNKCLAQPNLVVASS